MRINITLDKEQKISQATLDALEAELYRNLQPIYPKTAIRIRKGSANGVELSGLKLDEDKKRVMEIMQQVRDTLEQIERDKRARQRASMTHDF